MDRVKEHFEEEAIEFDSTILKLVPHYPQMIEALVSVIPFEKKDQIKIIDLGSGTGYISMKLKEAFPNSIITCLDFAENMIAQSKLRLEKYKDVNYLLADIREFEFDKNYHAVVSSLTLHHLETKKDKIKFYKKVFESLESGGVFYNADIVLGSNDFLNKTYVSRWKEFMAKSIPEEEIENKWMVNHYKEDRPEILLEQIEWIKNIGFEDVDIVWKYYNFAVYGGIKP